MDPALSHSGNGKAIETVRSVDTRVEDEGRDD